MGEPEPLEGVAVVIVSHNTRDTLLECLRALTAGGSEAALEVVVVDTGSTDGSAEAVAGSFPRVRLVSTRNVGFGAACNLGAAESRRPLVLYLNADCFVGPGAVRAMAERFGHDPKLGFVGPRILLPSGRDDHAALRADPDLLGAALYFSRLPRLFPRSPRLNRYALRHLDYTREQPLLAGTAACLMFRRGALDEVGGFDEAFFMYGEDLDLCRRVRAAGYTGLYLPGVRALHKKGEATRKTSFRMLIEFHRAMWRYYEKHEAHQHGAVVNIAVRIAVAGLAGVRLLVNALRSDRRVSAR